MVQDYVEKVEPYVSQYLEHQIESGRTVFLPLDTAQTSEESLTASFKDVLLPKVILVNHEKRLPVDAVCANIAIKFNMMYLSVYQLIKKEIDSNSDFGKKLLATKKSKPLSLQFEGKDEYQEEYYSAAHFELNLVV